MEDQVEIDVTIPTNKWVRIAVIAISAFGAGSGIGYYIGKRNATVTIVQPEEKKPVNENQLTIFDAEEKLAMIADAVEAEVMERLDDALEEDTSNIGRVVNPIPAGFYRATEPPEELVVDVDPPVVQNVFARTTDAYWNYDEEVANRSKTVPYVIHQEEFVADEMEYRQETLTYYAGDDIMADADDKPVYNYTGLMGDLKFGHGSGDPNVVYIRNDALHMEWEILQHTGKFEQEVLGHTMEYEAENELRHSVLKFRD